MRTRLFAWVAALAAAYAVLTALADPRRFVADSPGANLVVQTTAALVAVLVAVIALGRFHQRRQYADLLLVLALAQLAVGNLLFTVLPLAQGLPVSGRTVGAGTATRLTGALLLAAAAHVRPRAVDAPRRTHTDALAVAAATALLVGVGYLAARLFTPDGAGAVDPAHRLWDSAPWLALLSAAVAVASGVAAVGFARGHGRNPADELLAWLAVATIAQAGSHAVTAVTFLETYSRYVSMAELLRLAAYLLLLGGVLREVRGAWRDHAAAAVADERGRIARDLHDGLAQELAYVVTRTRRLARRLGDDDLWDVCSAAERALDESRRAIAALSHDDDDPLPVALAHTAQEVGDRLGTAVTLELDDVEVPGATKEALLRIAREAITNAARHGAATRVHVRLFAGGTEVHLRVSDNGRGFDAAAAPAAGRLGVTGMRERAAALGGQLTIASQRPGGTEVEVVLP